MYSTRLQIDTKVGKGAGPSSSKSPRERNNTSAVLRGKSSFSSNAASGRRLRSVSNASTSSTMSVISPTYSSSNGSGSSVHLPQNGSSSMDPTSSAPTSPVLEETICLSAEYVLAMHDFAPQQQDANCLSFRAGQIIHVLNRDSSGWWDGELEGQRGWFPSNYVNAEAGVTSLTEEDLPRGNVSTIFKPSIDDVHFCI